MQDAKCKMIHSKHSWLWNSYIKKMLRHRETWWITIEWAREHWVVQFECIWSNRMKENGLLAANRRRKDWFLWCLRRTIERKGRLEMWRWWFCGLRNDSVKSITCKAHHSHSFIQSFIYRNRNTAKLNGSSPSNSLTTSVQSLSTFNFFFQHSKISAKITSQGYFIKMREIHCQFPCKGSVTLHQSQSVKSAAHFHFRRPSHFH